jgi:pyrroline-5-carboxylate reductase
MRYGLIGAGNIATAFARGLGEPVGIIDGGSGRAEQLAEEVGGAACADLEELAASSGFLVLAHKPGQLEQIAGPLREDDTPVLSLLGPTTLAELRAAYPQRPVFRALPNLAIGRGEGVTALAPTEGEPAELAEEVRSLFGSMGWVCEVSESMITLVNTISGVGPAYAALFVEAQVDAAIRQGIPAPLANELAIRTMRGAAGLLAAEDDTLGLRRSVASPGGSTVLGLAALERGGLRAAFHDASDAVLGT